MQNVSIAGDENAMILFNHRSRDSGFSLIELMLVLAVAAVLLGMGATFLRDFIQSQRLTTDVNEFFAAIVLARSEAIQRGVRVDLLPVDGSDWARGWVVVVDENGNQRADSGEKVIFMHGPVSQGISIRAALTDSRTQYLAYNAAGRTRTNASSERTQFGSFTFRIGDQVRKINLNFLGRARICNPQTDRNSC